MKKGILHRALAVCMISAGMISLCTALTGCGSAKEQIKLSVWTTETKIGLIEKALKSFQELHEDEVEIEWRVSKESEDTCKETVLSNPEGAADIYAFADDQLDELKDAGALLTMSADPAKALQPFGGEGSVAYESVVRDGKMYAYPETANGYFMYYNKKYFHEDDIGSLERMIKIAGNENKKVVMDLSSGWYLYSFFRGAGMTLNPDESGTKNICDWNRKEGGYTGIDVAKSLMDISLSRGFKSMPDDDFIKGVQDGSVIAGVNGAWNADIVRDAWGDDYGASKLPTFQIAGGEEQMASFTGYKVLGINAHTKYATWCEKFVEYFTSKDNQIAEFEETGEVPANLEIVESGIVKDAPAVIALEDQLPYATLQRVAGNYWEAASKFGVTIASGNPDKRNLQKLLDIMVEGITS